MNRPPPRQSSPYPWLCFGVLALSALVLLWRATAPTESAPVIAAPALDSDALDRLAANAETQTALYSLPLTPTPTASPTMIPTATPTRPAATINLCDPARPQEGTLCQMPPPSTATPAPKPECPTTPNAWCIWPVVGTTSRQETR